MARLTYKRRQKLSASEFAEPKDRKYPIQDESHARNALARVSQFGDPAEKAKIRRKVHNAYPGIAVTGTAGKAGHKGKKSTGKKSIVKR